MTPTDLTLAPLAPLARYLDEPGHPLRLAALAQRNALATQYVHIPAYVCRRLCHVGEVRRLGDLALSVQWPALLRAAELWDPTKGGAFKTYAIRCCHLVLLSQAHQHQSVIRLPDYTRDTRPGRKLVREIAVARKVVGGLGAVKAPKGGAYGRKLNRCMADAARSREAPPAADAADLAAAVLSQLRPRFVQVLTWRFWDGLTGAEIGRRLGVTRARAQQFVDQALAAARRVATEMGETG